VMSTYQRELAKIEKHNFQDKAYIETNTKQASEHPKVLVDKGEHNFQDKAFIEMNVRMCFIFKCSRVCCLLPVRTKGAAGCYINIYFQFSKYHHSSC
jgi:hypothetical protein